MFYKGLYLSGFVNHCNKSLSEGEEGSLGGKEEAARTSTRLPTAGMAFLQFYYVRPGALMLRISSVLYDILSFSYHI